MIRYVAPKCEKQRGKGMKKRKKWICGQMAAVMMLTLLLMPVCSAGAPRTSSFEDTKGHWAESYVDQAVDLGFINGYGNGKYGPDDRMTRAQFATILWREAGQPEPAGKASFTDLDPKQTYYHKAVAWAEENGVMNGVGNGQFAPNSNVTREQMATTLFRMSGGVSGMELMFGGIYEQALKDSGEISSWAKPAIWWSIYNKILCGTDQLELVDTISPGEAATRAQIAVMIVRYHE